MDATRRARGRSVVATPAACVTVKVWPAIVTVVVRLSAIVEAAAVNVTTILPVPVVALSVSHAADEVAVHVASA